MAKSILIVEDDKDIQQLLSVNLSDYGYEVTTAGDGASGLKKGLEKSFDLIILDVMMPEMDGFEVCKKLRESSFSGMILMLTVKSDVVDKILGLELGADDYLSKPFNLSELSARVKALLRRGNSGSEPAVSQEQLSIGLVRLDIGRHKAFVAEQEVELTPREFDLLLFLLKRPGRPVTRQDLLLQVWGYESTGYEHTVDTHVNRLRSKIEPDPSNPLYILTVWGVGYRFVEDSELGKKS